ncbi:MAG: cation:proton antiporter [Candidatus Hydrogenedentes bacterium]|jgi:Kef-type K+ transport system membrane component KefB/mannitol/fructose-specific phosphotransferase system IIA component (Ntr-type)/nucleotide-binding universal stress UspA family protein|nr:cation:proton antiporter [Candidatus Hydrogenedentota bacterium]
MITTALVMPLAAEKLRVPDMVLLLLAGTCLGPHGTGLLERNSAVMLFSSVGLLYIMFLAGLEIDLPQFIQSRNRSLVFGLLTFIIPQSLGTLLGRCVLHMEWPEAILLASMFASHTLLAFPVADKLGIVRSEPVAVTIGATIITDIMALMVLAVIADAAKGVALTPLFWVEILASLAALVAAGWWGIPWLSRWFFRNNSENGGAQFLFVLGTVCAFSYASHYARMEPIIGAFLAGLAFNRLIPQHSTLMNRIEFVGNTVFIPFFLISVGMLVNLKALVQDSQSWLVAATMVCGVILTKYLAAQTARRLFGYTREEGQVMFGLSVVQAAATLAAALVGYELHIFDVSVLNGAIAMILVTCPLGSWAVERYGRRMEIGPAAKPLLQKTEQRLLIPVANTRTAARLLDLAFVLRDTTRGSRLHPLTIVPDENDMGAKVAEGENLMAQCLARAASAEIPVEPRVRISTNTADGIVKAAREMHADLALFGWGQDKTVATRIFGTVRKRMLQECPSRLMFCRLVTSLNTTRRLRVPLPPRASQRSDIGDLAAESQRLARQLGAKVHLYICNPEETERMEALFEKTIPETPCVVTSLNSWETLRERLLGDLTPDDMVLLPSERPLGTFWRPSMNRLPDIIAERFPQLNLLIAYPALVEYAPPSEYEIPDSISSHLILPVTLDQAQPLDMALQTMAARLCDRDAPRNDILELLRQAAANYPVELVPGIVMLHAHSDSVGSTTILVGAGGAGWSFPGVETPAGTILALISPRSKSPEIHLAALSQLARACREGEFTRAIREPMSAEDIAGVLKTVIRKAIPEGNAEA